MRRILILATAVTIAATGAAIAKSKTYVIALGGKFCVTANVNVKGVAVTANESDSCQTYIGEGFVGKVKGAGTVAIIGGQSSAYPSTEITITLKYPFATGGAYTVYGTTDGMTMVQLGSGTYTVK